MNSLAGRHEPSVDPGQIKEFIISGFVPAALPVLSDAAQLSTASSRAEAVAQWIMNQLSHTSNVALRTGTIVLLTTAIREVVSYYIAEAVQASDLSAKDQALASAAVMLLGPAVNLVGLTRDSVGGVATLQTVMGRLAMCGITVGAVLAAYVTGASKTMLATSVASTTYVVLRDVSNAFFPLNDNAGPPSLPASAAAGGLYAIVQGGVESLAALAPPSGAARASQHLDLSFLSALLPALINSAGSVVDDLIYFNSRLAMPSPSQSADAFPPEPRGPAYIRSGFTRPSWTQLTNKLTTNAALRGSAATAINATIAAVAVQLAADGTSDRQAQDLLIIGVSVMVMLIYLPFVYGCQQRTNTSYSPNG
ncbi:hypothetical protein [Pseudomonas fluorescens]|uniref:hypothetical protein n=1 Tax=Pseudomonas fluorescens TaxID=294 RepID=UPI001241AD4C|nr:hypothetical protein [Pseudomonas fluorescens]